MKTHFYNLTLYLVIVSLLPSCKPEKDVSFQFKITPKFGNQTLAYETPYTNPDNSLMAFSRFLIYLSDVRLIKSDQSEVKVKDIVLYSSSEPNSATTSLQAKAGNYIGIKFGIGLTAAQNSTDPATISDDNNPLSAAHDTYWSTSLKYVFSKMEGRIDTSSSHSGYTNTFSYHVGTDALYKQVYLQKSFSIAANSNLNLIADLQKFFTGTNAINYITEPVTSTTDNVPLATKIATKWTDVLSLE